MTLVLFQCVRTRPPTRLIVEVGGFLFCSKAVAQMHKSPRHNAKQYKSYCVIEKGGKSNVECEVVVGE